MYNPKFDYQSIPRVVVEGRRFYATPDANLKRGTIPITYYTSGIGTSGIAGTTNYALFPSANDTITLPVGTYFVKMGIRIAVSGSTVWFAEM